MGWGAVLMLWEGGRWSGLLRSGRHLSWVHLLQRTLNYLSEAGL